MQKNPYSILNFMSLWIPTTSNINNSPRDVLLHNQEAKEAMSTGDLPFQLDILRSPAGQIDRNGFQCRSGGDDSGHGKKGTAIDP